MGRNANGQRVAREGSLAGRPLSFTPDVGARFVMLSRGGNYFETCAAMCGRSVNTVREWIRRGERVRQDREKAEAPTDPVPCDVFEALARLVAPLADWRPNADLWFAAFAECVQIAEAEAEARNLGLIQRAATENPAAAQWFLERRYPGRWGKRDAMELTGPEGAPLTFYAPKKTDDDE